MPCVKCTRCRGTGKVELTGEYAETYALLLRQKAHLSGADLARLSRVKPTAMNNRLVAIERMGLAIGSTHGRKRLWRAVK